MTGSQSSVPCERSTATTYIHFYIHNCANVDKEKPMSTRIHTFVHGAGVYGCVFVCTRASVDLSVSCMLKSGAEQTLHMIGILPALA